jgi:hypothetical protein
MHTFLEIFGLGVAARFLMNDCKRKGIHGMFGTAAEVEPEKEGRFFSRAGIRMAGTGAPAADSVCFRLPAFRAVFADSVIF